MARADFSSTTNRVRGDRSAPPFSTVEDSYSDLIKRLAGLKPHRIIYIGDARALEGRLWQEMRGEVGPEELSGNLIVQLGLATEDLNRPGTSATPGGRSRRCRARVKHPVIAFMVATLDGVAAGTGAVYEAGRCQWLI